jgi:hypothetical protein
MAPIGAVLIKNISNWSRFSKTAPKETAQSAPFFVVKVLHTTINKGSELVEVYC